jgi:hypothetical protein
LQELKKNVLSELFLYVLKATEENLNKTAGQKKGIKSLNSSTRKKEKHF